MVGNASARLAEELKQLNNRFTQTATARTEGFPRGAHSLAKPIGPDFTNVSAFCYHVQLSPWAYVPAYFGGEAGTCPPQRPSMPM